MFAHLANLFFEQCKIITEDEEDAMKVDFSLERNSDEYNLQEKQFLTREGVELLPLNLLKWKKTEMKKYKSSVKTNLLAYFP